MNVKHRIAQECINITYIALGVTLTVSLVSVMNMNNWLWSEFFDVVQRLWLPLFIFLYALLKISDVALWIKRTFIEKEE